MSRAVLKSLYGVGLLRRLYRARLPFARPYGRLLAAAADGWDVFWGWLKNVLFYDPMLRARCDRVGRDVQVHGTFPLIQNDGRIEIGDRVSFGGMNNLIVGLPVEGWDDRRARLTIGDDVVVGFWSEINVASSVVIGNHVRFATGVLVFDNNSHRLDPESRRRHLPMTPDDVADVVLEDDVWVGMNAIILKGVRVGRGSVIAAGAVVTKDVPPGVVAAGNPARVVKQIPGAGNPAAAAEPTPADAPGEVRT